jgi:hypothetical protein
MKRIMLFLSVLVLSCGLLFLSGCEGSDAKKSVTETVKNVVGTEVARKAQEVDKKVSETMKQEVKRFLESSGNKDEENSGESKDSHE